MSDQPSTTDGTTGTLRQRVTSRKFIAYVVGMILSTVLIFEGTATFALWSEFVLYLTAIYTLGNVGAKGVSTLFTQVGASTRPRSEQASQ